MGHFKSWEELVGKFSSRKILVWGDAVLDEYIYGEMWRISREAPVPILKYRSKKYRLGGAANAVNNLVSLGAKVYFWGWVGNDGEGEKILSLLRDKGVNTQGIKIEERESVVKTRIMAGGMHRFPQQMLRIDKGEENSEVDREFFRREWQRIKKEIDGVLISDYGYGSVDSSLYEEIRKDKEIWVVDSRFALASFTGPSVVTPNEEEAMQASGAKDALQGAERLQEKIKAEAVVLTLGNKGMVILSGDKPPHFLDIYGTREVVDVTGAGDTVASLITLALSSGTDILTAAEIANVAAGLVVLKPGVATVSQEELKEALHVYKKDYHA